MAFLACFGIGLKAEAYTTVTGLDVNCPSTNPSGTNPPGCTQTVRPTNDIDNAPRIPFPNSLQAANTFLAILAGSGANSFGTETFDGFAANTPVPLNLSFPTITSPSTVSATLTSPNTTSLVAQVGTAPDATDGNGRYPISGRNYLQTSFTNTGDFVVTFNRQVSAFGFYGVDIGDFGGTASITLSDTTRPGSPSTTLTVLPSTFFVPPDGRLSGSVLYFGVAATTSGEFFNRVTFSLGDTNTTADNFAFDNFTVGLRLVPAPLPILGAGMALLWSRSLRRKIKTSKLNSPQGIS